MTEIKTGDRVALEALLSADLRALNAQSDQIGRFFAEVHQLSATEFHALLHIMVGESSGTPLTTGHLQQRMRLTNAGITYLVRRMIAAGHIRQDTDLTDRRKRILRYEHHGMELARSFFGHLGAANRIALAPFTDEQLQTTHQVMSTLTGAMAQFATQLVESRSNRAAGTEQAGAGRKPSSTGHDPRGLGPAPY
jgi:DNA-binding MarR family transcriptional regulator